MSESEVLADLIERLEGAVESLTDLCCKAAALHNPTEYARLSGKRSGVELALSFVRDAMKTIPEEVAT